MKNHLELIQHSFSTILLDAIQFFPQNKKRVSTESFGLLFGLKKETGYECDFAFPVGSVSKRTEDLVQPDQKINEAIQSAKCLFSTSKWIGTYHSHPHDEYFEHWADPSNADVEFAQYLNLPYMVIIALTRNGKKNKPLSLDFKVGPAGEYFYNKNKHPQDYPDAKLLNEEVNFIQGEFQKYFFTIRVYHFNGTSLRDVDLFSTEAELLQMLRDENVNVSDLTTAQTYHLRKIESNLRNGGSGRSKENTEYHLNKIKMMSKL
jgi:proteasome lid subunit RPN8/RPN11